MDAVVLAGGLNAGPLRAKTKVLYEAEIEIDGKPMISYVIDALRSVPEVKRIVVAIEETALADKVKKSIDLVASPGNNVIESLINCLYALASTEPVLVLTADIPLISKEALKDFIYQCERREAKLFYSCTSKEINERKYPGVQRTYVRLKEGVFTGGNVALISPEIILQHRDLLDRAASLRKKPLELCRMLGWKYLLFLLLGKLTIKDIEERVGSILQFSVAGIISPFPEVGIDVDKASDLKLVTAILQKQEGKA